MLLKEFVHIPVLLNEVLKGLKIKPNGIYVDATVGAGGHSLKIAEKLTTGRIIALDQDPDAVFVAKEKLKNYNVTVHHANFSKLKEILKEEKIQGVDGVLLDLGVSSFQLDAAERGFSYKTNSVLDMRMSKTGKSAKEILNTATKEELIYILKTYGEEKFAKKIAEEVIKKREISPINTTSEFAQIVKNSIPFKFKRLKNPCKKSFQALRIAVNNELLNLEKVLKDSFSVLNKKARLLVISFNSLEDRIVKNFYKEKAAGCICSKKIPVCICNNKPKAIIITKKPIVPTKEEILKNNRAHSSKLRILEKI